MQQIINYPHIEIAGENALIIYLSDEANPSLSKKISQLKTILAEELSNCLIELIPSYISLLVIFDPLVSDYFAVKHTIFQRLAVVFGEPNETSVNKNIIEIPVYYSAQSGPDLSNIAKNSGLTVEEVINIHQENTYQVYAIGFAPGFAFLGEVDSRIAMPRLSTPRKKVPKGSVAIADQQTAIYPESSPGGWNLIGLCPLTLFEPSTTPHIPYQVGDSVKFKAITKGQFLKSGGTL
ncbi:5-oxoprolinase subunit PxpB [Colwellia sp. RSH04]|uniref:5-oxoprolinase subunit PxpB n=1 Tax=Colwellia sp. RSH04 TaxID=2305464 RepID=UPI000E583DD6|nr:5-oxoprolinase subunit PxpB [Colwellia sp. RSH04]RHW76501.1 5-oxoprolinase subunit PxpB [Colwellia sp. RSH04]